MQRPAYLVLALLTGLGGCGRDDAAPPPTTPIPPTLPGVYAGQFPCSNCDAIDATLWLRPDGRFFLRQRFAGGEPPPAGAQVAQQATYGLGRWSWDEHTAETVLRGAGPERRVKAPSPDRLELVVASPIPHVLLRQLDAPPFGDRVSLDGESTVSANGATFTECLTGLPFVVASAGAYRELKRQHSRLNPRGKVALTSVEAHIVTTTDGAEPGEQLVLDRFVTLKPGTPCPTR